MRTEVQEGTGLLGSVLGSVEASGVGQLRPTDRRYRVQAWNSAHAAKPLRSASSRFVGSS